MPDKNDWRLVNQKEYLMNACLLKLKYKSRGDSDHEHCAFCWDKFSESSEDLNEGYCTKDGKYWICKECFNDFRDEFGFNLEY